jgi:hypothetical protein
MVPKERCAKSDWKLTPFGFTHEGEIPTLIKFDWIPKDAFS